MRLNSLKPNRSDLDPNQVGYSLGFSLQPPGGHELWSRLDQSMRVIGPSGSGKTLRIFAPLLRDAPGPAIGTTTKPDLVQLTWKARRRVGPVACLDPFGVAPGVPRVRWNPVVGCENTRTAELRGRAFVAGVQQKDSRETEGGAWYRRAAGSLIMCALHAAACEQRSLRTWLAWCRDLTNPDVRGILTRYQFGAVDWDQVWDAYATGDTRTVGNTKATITDVLACFLHEDIVSMCDYRQGFDVESFLDASGTVYLLGKERESSISPLFTAIAEDILDRAEDHANTKPWSRLSPPLVAALDEIALLVPIPSLPQRVGDGRGRGLCVVYGAQSWSQVVSRYGETDAKSLADMTNNVVVFGGCKDPDFLQELESLSGKVHGERRNFGSPLARTMRVPSGNSDEVQPAMWAHEIQQLELGAAYVLAGSMKPIKAYFPAMYERDGWQQIQAEAAELAEIQAGQMPWD